ncbi:hypothetical protein A2755_01185 [Candidatus Wolfebacteria bacterium RIFCSPHIGHO2_01_FULL_48_22]|uniref:Uncharacterized protein n=2 Tax=Candidatus Wolfeibacteriota TaxID=1752735 RepID=A0A1F8DUP5_9BACT|nr:MAG: hypothetical protein A2755_01185 [Candidatus Wolfebacteria bacterium RIFCSPHIGHO2_01_FULL_48_22]OGM93932.1 MAG: hypothetical protein A2935_03610 [Candidatus Wolfebacteria bacterium RIFCSPLOWO2_01_FULL_47_17b]
MMQRVRSFLFENRTSGQTIAKNTFWIAAGQIVSRLIKAVLVAYAARVLGASEWGTFSYAMSLAALFTLFMDFGINAVITRESSRDLSVQQRYFSTAFVIKVLMFIAITLFVVLVVPFFVSIPEVLVLLPLVVFMLGVDGLRDFGASLSRAWEKMEVEAGIQILTNVCIVVAGFVALVVSRTALSLVWGYLIGTSVGMIFAYAPYRSYVRNIFKMFDRGLIKKILYASWPFGMVGLMGAIMLNTNTIMLGWFRSIEEVGYYGAVQRIMWLLYAIPGFLSSAFFPQMAKLIADTEGMRKILERGLSFLTLIAVPMTAAGILLAWEIMFVVFGDEYTVAAEVFRITSLTFLPVFLSTMFGNALFALNKEKKLFMYVGIGIVSNVVLNLALIPLWGMSGAALSAVLSQLLITSYLVYVLRKEFSFRIFHNVWKVLLASVAMAAVLVVLRVLKIDTYVMIAVGGAVYLFVSFLLKEPGLRLLWEKIRGLQKSA